MEPPEVIPGSSAAYELRSLMRHRDVAHIVGVNPTTVYRWGATWGAIVSEPFLSRLLLTHELAFSLVSKDPDFDVREWFLSRSTDGPSPAALIAHHPAAAVREHLVLAARETLGPLEGDEREALAGMRQRARIAELNEQSQTAAVAAIEQAKADVAAAIEQAKAAAAAAKIARARRAASQMLEALRPEIAAGQLGILRDGRVLLVPSETTDRIRTVAPTSMAAMEPQLIGRGLAALGATTYGGKNTVARRVNGHLKRVWDLPQDVVFSENRP